MGIIDIFIIMDSKEIVRISRRKKSQKKNY